MNRTEFLKDITINSNNKVARTAIDKSLSTAHLNLSLPERKAMGLKMMLESMPVYIGEQELVVGTRTLFGESDLPQSERTVSDFKLFAYPSYINDEDVKHFGFNEEFLNKTHATPDYGIILEQGIGGIINNAKARLEKQNSKDEVAFLKSVIIAYEGLYTLITRYSEHAMMLSQKEEDEERKQELIKIHDVCKHISINPARDFYDAIQLFHFAQLTTIIESIQFINYGRADVFLAPYLGDMDRELAQQLIDCVLLKMYDQVDIHETYLHDYAAQLNLTLGGVDSEGESAVNDITYMFLDAIDRIRLPEPLVSLRINSKNPPQFLEKCAKLSVTGCNFFAYYNDDLFIESMVLQGVDIKTARGYAFDLCQDITFPGTGDLYCCGATALANELMSFLETSCEYPSFESFYSAFKQHILDDIQSNIQDYIATEKAFIKYKNGDKEYYFDELKAGSIAPNLNGKSLMSPLPFLSGMYHGCIESATDFTRNGYKEQHVGYIIGTPTEAINAIAAIKKMVYEDEVYTLSEVYDACKRDYVGNEQMRQALWNSPKWGNDDDYVDLPAKDLLESCCMKINEYNTNEGGRFLAGIHQPHPVGSGHGLMATPEGRHYGMPVSVTLTPESGTMKNGPTAALKSAAKIDYRHVQWNMCVMINYYASIFIGNDGYKLFIKLLQTYFKMGGLQHQPNVMDPDDLKLAQINPEDYKDLTVRLWGVSAHFIDLPKELQDELIQRLAY